MLGTEQGPWVGDFLDHSGIISAGGRKGLAAELMALAESKGADSRELALKYSQGWNLVILASREPSSVVG